MEQRQKRQKKPSQDVFGFSWSQTLSNPNGKSSLTAVIGISTAAVCLVVILALTVYYFCVPAEAEHILEFIGKITTLFSLDAGIIGVKSVANGFGKGNQVVITKDGDRVTTSYHDSPAYLYGEPSIGIVSSEDTTYIN